ncbi:MAG: ACT domain-containing protein [Clostridiaceae bacterium]|nr:ACT domain-containing protein [Clostridiaceae bacterium]
MTNRPVSNINVTYNVALVTIDKLPNDTRLISEIFNTIAKQNINIDMISQAPPFRGSVNISFSIPSAELVNALSALNEFKKNAKDLRVEVDADNTKLQVYGEGMRNLPGVAARLFTVLAGEGIEIKLVTTSEVDISYLIYEKDVDKAINAIKKEYGLQDS